MAKRPTIGENPLDTVMADTSLEAVVPLRAPQAGKRPAAAEPAPEAEKRLQLLEAEIKVLKGEVSLLRGQVMELQTRIPSPEPRWVTKLRDRLAGK